MTKIIHYIIIHYLKGAKIIKGDAKGMQALLAPEKVCMQKTASTSYLYFLRIFCALLVILLHCVSPFYSNVDLFGKCSWWILGVLNCISRTAVPCFFMMSGYLMLSNKKTLQIKDFYKKRLPHLIIPLALWNVIYYIYFNGNLNIVDFINQVLNMGTAYHLWFMYSMIAFYILLPFIKRIIDNSTYNELWLLTFVLFFSNTIKPFINTFLPIYINLFDTLINGHIPYFLLGYLLGKTEFNFKKRIIIYICGFLGLFMCVYGNWYFYKKEGLYLIFNEAYRLNHVICSGAVFVIFKNIKWDKLVRFKKIAKEISKLTFGIYFIHALVLDVLYNFVPQSLTPLEAVLFEFVSTLFISFVIIYIVSKIKVLKNMLM